MSKENCKNVSNCKQSFKAVENFLRKVAFNLGNTESKTEVKIISCIPIDVTDLQQRIFQLQNQLADYKGKEPKPCFTCAKRAESKRQVLCNELLFDSTNILSSSYTGGDSSAQLRPSESTEPCESRDCNECPPISEKTAKTKLLFTKNKGAKKKARSRLVYRAQTEINTPFSNNKSLPDDIAPMKPKTNNNENLSRLYLADVIKKQYDNRQLANDYSGLSDISTPICRDHVPCSPNSPYLESDACSCFHGQFQNVDKYMTNRNCSNQYPTFNTLGKFDNNSYYDSKFYDLVPVKEKIIKHRNVIDKHKRREPKNLSITKCRPEHIRPKHRDAAPMVVNYCTTSPIRNKFVRLDASSNDKHVVIDRMDRMAATKFVASTPRRFKDDIELGPVYAKQRREYKKPNIITTNPRHNMATGSSARVNIAAQQTAASAGTITDPPADKTETTLNQIKTMLQTVLTEVKTKSYIEKPPAQNKKDAVVQNGPTRTFEYGASKLLQSYTYSPYNMNPFVPSCSPPMSCSNYVYPEYTETQGIPFQQYPLLIQPQKHMCNNYYRNNNFTRPITKYATTAATNTEQTQERSKETEQLIKEIYKSMALNMDESSKDNSIREYTKTKAAEKKCVNTVKIESDHESRSIAQAISEIFRNSHLRDSTVTGTTDTTLNSYLDPNKTKPASEDTVKRDHKTERNYHHNAHYTKHKRDREMGRMATHHEIEEQNEQSDDTVIEDTEDASTETEVDRVLEAREEPVKSMEPKKEKSGLFKKMLKIFQPRRRRRRAEENEGEKESESDSDDYQTVYSHKVVDATPKQKRIQTVRSRPHSKVFYSKQPQRRTSRTKSPEKHTRTASYIEREYKKYWDEKLMHHEQQRLRYNPGSRPAPDRDQRNRHYYQNYEARPIIVEPIRQAAAPPRPPANIIKPRYTVSRNYRHGESNEPRKNPGYNYPIVRNNTSSGSTGPHFATAKNGTRKATFAKVWLKKCKPCAQQWKNFIVNG